MGPHIIFRNSNAEQWQERFEEAGVLVTAKRKGRFKVSVTPDEFTQHKELLQQAIEETVKEYEG